MKEDIFSPKLFSLIKEGISHIQLKRDLMAGVVVGIVALPLAIAFAIASGVTPEQGLITAVVAGFIISVLRGSRVQIGGPTGAFIVIIAGIVGKYGQDALIVATFMAGVLIIIMGLMRLGNWLKFIPYPLIIGFTSAIAVIIFSTQLGAMFGFNTEEIPEGVTGTWTFLVGHIGDTNLISLGIAVLSILLTAGFHRLTPKIPGALVAILCTSAMVYFFQLPVATIETAFGEVKASIGVPHFPSLDYDTIRSLIQPALAIAILGSIESLLSAVVADGMIGSRHRPNTELIAQGTANIFSAAFGGIPATGAIARTATNVKNGGRTPVAGIAHALTLLLIMLFMAPYAKLIPLSCLAGILAVVAYNMSEWRHFVRILKGNRSDVLIMLTTFGITLLFDLVIAIEVGVVLSSFLFMKRMSESLEIRTMSQEVDVKEKLFEEEIAEIPKGVVLYEINGPLFFGASRHFQDVLSNINRSPGAVILRMRNVPFVDATGMENLAEVVHAFRKKGSIVVLSGVSDKVRDELRQAGFFEKFPELLVCSTIQESIRMAEQGLREG